jgi:hypothetical protein
MEVIDQCAINNGGCDHYCQSTLTSGLPGIGIVCSCHDGYHLQADRRTCRGTQFCNNYIMCIHLYDRLQCKLSIFGHILLMFFTLVFEILCNNEFVVVTVEGRCMTSGTYVQRSRKNAVTLHCSKMSIYRCA